jgi:hypothetical protein
MGSKKQQVDSLCADDSTGCIDLRTQLAQDAFYTSCGALLVELERSARVHASAVSSSEVKVASLTSRSDAQSLHGSSVVETTPQDGCIHICTQTLRRTHQHRFIWTMRIRHGYHDLSDMADRDGDKQPRNLLNL